MKSHQHPFPHVLSTFLRYSLCAAAAVFGFATTALHAAAGDDSSFFLKDGDRVCFYGDSITEQRFYGADVQACIRTRFPNLHVDFVNSGVGGDRVTGGWAGPIDLRLERDVFPFKPTVVTIMLGMNDGRYRAFDQEIYNTYTNGYEHIIQSLQAHLPGVRIVLIQPSAFDDVTLPPKFPGGYNAVLQRYSAFVSELANRHNLLCVDFNGPQVSVMQKAFAQNPELSHGIIPGRVHPSAAGELVMAQALLQAWNVPATVTAVTLNAKGKVARSENTAVSDFKADDDGLSWTQNDACLPFPVLALHDDWDQFPPYSDPKGKMSFLWKIPQPKWNYTNAVTQMTIDDSALYQALDEQPLKVIGLAKGNYFLKINGQAVGEFSAEELHHGVNLAEYHTPMLDQSYREMALVWKQIQWRFIGWREIQLKFSDNPDPAVQQAVSNLVDALRDQEQDIVKQQYAAAVPQTTHYELIPAESDDK